MYGRPLDPWNICWMTEMDMYNNAKSIVFLCQCPLLTLLAFSSQSRSPKPSLIPTKPSFTF